ncbi:tRNA pseudouridine(55) synthase TruB [Clostridium cellulovorans]|uniref:tRNA pseudouridine synthase B n=1 Tax=Clostridium cellulovorans (strain ATCC 35296 / DSM 3052 / OCM 3 / 743B) TaxID=573061 RepID=D9SKN9_CLOC7|nr:tRNA pseudouridine(55) synthase TruB [Clostridium cellulovorans]ADL51535.1 tRNA pseudouridine synthase B [Clostridium cellulovorans 743B]
MNGIINVYKPQGITSFDVVRSVKKITGQKKIGHTGTLDPLATGVLPICIGRATKLVDYIMNGRKTYIATLKLGVETDTYDREGEVLKTLATEHLSEAEVKEAINSFIGEIKQVPPMYSALKVQGKRLYELAREGKEVERNERSITIYDIKILEIKVPDIKFEVVCSKGTYIRSLCFDIGEKLKCGGAMWDLERTASSSFKKENSVTLEELAVNYENHIISIEEAIMEFSPLYYNEKIGNLLLNGVCLNNPNIIKNIEFDKIYRVYKEKELLGLGMLQEKGFKIITLLN